MSKVKEILELLYGHALLHQNNQFEKDDIDLALSELRGLVMGMKEKMPITSADKMRDIDIYNSAVETIANELFGKE